MQVEHHIKTLPAAQTWALFLEKMALLLGSALLGSGLICWVAANWADATVFQKLGGVQALFVLALIVAYVSAYRLKHAADIEFTAFAVAGGLAGVIVGALFALIGQIYQTGADAWELFLLWAAMLTPLLLAVRSVFLGLLLSVVLNVGLALYFALDARHIFGWGGDAWLSSAMLMVALNFVLLLGWELSLAYIKDSCRVGPRACATAAVSWLAVATLAAFDTNLSIPAIIGPGLLVAGLLYAVYAYGRRDAAMTYLAGLTACGLVAFGMLTQVESPEGLLAVVLVLLVLAGFVLRHLARQWWLAHASEGERRAGQPWYVTAFLLIVMWIGAVLLAGLTFWFFQFEVDDAWWIGLIVMGLGLAWMRALSRESSQDLLPASLVVAGMLMFCLGVVFHEGEPPRWLSVAGVGVVSAVAYVLGRTFVLRLLVALGGLTTLLVLTWPDMADYYDLLGVMEGYGLPAQIVVALYWRIWLAALAAIFLLAAARGGSSAQAGLPLAWALIVSVLFGVWFAPAPDLALHVQNAAWQAELVLLWLACAVLPLCALAAFVGPLKGMGGVYRFGGPLALGLACVGWMGAPGIAVSLLWLILGYAWSHRSLIVVGVLGMVVYLGRFYYQMDSSLIQKSWILGATGVWLVLCGLCWYRARSAAATPSASAAAAPAVAGSMNDSVAVSEPDGPVNVSGAPAGRNAFWPVSGWRRLALVAAGVAVLGVANTGIYQREAILADGRPVVLELAPVDPRSLMQGDYMALRFAVADDAADLLASDTDPVAAAINKQGHGYMILKEDDGRHRLAGLSADYADNLPSSPVILLHFRLRDGQVRMPTDAWFFAEGRAQHYEQARFGEFRVDDKGTGLLKRLLDDKGQSLD